MLAFIGWRTDNIYCFACVLSRFSCVQLFATLLTVAPQAPLSLGFSRQEHSNELSCPPPGDLTNPGIKPASSTTSSISRRVLYQ